MKPFGARRRINAIMKRKKSQNTIKNTSVLCAKVAFTERNVQTVTYCINTLIMRTCIANFVAGNLVVFRNVSINVANRVARKIVALNLKTH